MIVPSSARACLATLTLLLAPRPAFAGGPIGPRVEDLSLLVAPGYPTGWPTWPRFLLDPCERIGPLSAYNSETLMIDGNTGTQLDVPTHSVTPADSGRPNAGAFGKASTETIAAWQFGGEACVIDCRDLLDQAPPGKSPLITRDRVIAWEKEHRRLRFGDAVLFRSGFSDKYYKPLPEGRKYAADPVEGLTPGWPDPDPDCMEYLATRGVMTLGTDSTSMGPLGGLAEPTHFAGLRHGMIWAESLTNLDVLPTTGAFYCMLAPKHAGGAFSELRAITVKVNRYNSKLIESARNKRALDLSVTMADDLPVSWPGKGVGNHRQPYMRVLFGDNPNTGTPFDTHLLDSHAGTHLVPPSYALPPEGFDDASYPPEVRPWLAEYEAKYGKRGHSDLTTENVSIAQSCGRARVINVSHLLTKTRRADWPASPEITADDIARDEAAHGPLKRGDIVLFRSDWSDRHFKPGPDGLAFIDAPLNGKSEGWPAPGPDAIVALAEKGIRCVGTDAPALGSVDPKQALMTYWAMGGKGMIGVESLTNLGKLPEGAIFLFAAVKLRDCHGGPGRALAFY